MTGNHVGCNSPRGFESPPFRHLLLAASSLLILLCSPAQYFGRQQDDLLYVIGAQSLASGHYRLFTMPGQPPMTMINPGFPLLLAPLAWLAGDRYGLYQAFCALILAGVPWLIWFWLRRKVDETAAVLIAALFASSPFVLSQAGTVMSEGFFTILALLSIMALERSKERTAGGLLFALTQTRTAGLALLPAGLGALHRQKWRQAGWIFLPPLAGMAAWNLYSRRVAGAVEKWEELELSYGGRLSSRTLAVVRDNAVYYLSSLGSCFLPESHGTSRAAVLLGVTVLGGALWGAFKLWKKDSSSPLVWAFAATVVLHAVWPWQYERYWIMPLPLLLTALAAASGSRARTMLAALLAAQVLFHVPSFLGGRSTWERPELERTYAWLSAHSRPEDILASALPVRDAFLARRPGIPLAPSSSSAALAGYLKERRARFVLRQDGLDVGLSLRDSAVVQRELDQAYRELEDGRFFELVHRDDNEGSRVYAIR